MSPSVISSFVPPVAFEPHQSFHRHHASGVVWGFDSVICDSKRDCGIKTYFSKRELSSYELNADQSNSYEKKTVLE